MRALPLAAAGLLLMLAVPATVAHAPRDCTALLAIPTSAGFILDPGETLSYAVPPDQFGYVASPSPLDVTLFPEATCEPDPACHLHGAVGATACGTYERAAFEIVNAGPAPAFVLVGAGLCGMGAVC